MVMFKRVQLIRGKLFKSHLLYALLSFACFTPLLLAACGDSTATNTPLPTTASPTTVPATTASPTTVPATTAVPNTTATGATTSGATTPGGTTVPGIPDEIKKPFALISTDLAKRSSLPASSFQISGFDMQTFPNSALGCPDPDLMYAQVLTPGYVIRVEAGGKTYDYRSNLAGTHVVLCGANGRPAPTS